MRRLLVIVLTLALVPTALAATKHGITPTSPKKGATVKVGSRPTFKGKVSGSGKVFVHVSKSSKRDSKGLIGNKEMFQKAKVADGRFTVKAKFYDFPEFWLNNPGTYYWQAYRIACENGDTSDCYQEGPVVKFKVG